MTGANVLVAIFGEKDSHAVYCLHQKGVTRLDVVNFISTASRKDPADPIRQQAQPEGARTMQSRRQAKEGAARSSYTQNLNSAGARRARSIR